MQVFLKRTWFAPDGFRRRARTNPNEVPDEYLSQVPSDSKVVDDKGKVLKDWKDPVPQPVEPVVPKK